MGCSDKFSTSPLVNAFNSRWEAWDAVAQGAVDTTQTLLNSIASQFSNRASAFGTYTSPQIDAPIVIDLQTLDIEAPVFTPPSAILNTAIESVDAITGNTVFPTAPDEPSLNLPNAPDAIDVDVPDNAPAVSDVSIPTAPVIVLPTAPTLYNLNLPTVPVLSFVDFTGTIPTFDALPPLESFGYSDATYTTTLEQPLVDKIIEWLLGGTGLPEYIWQAIWDKGRSNEEETGTKAVQEATEEFASRGFSLPPGALSFRIAETRQNTQNAVSTINREIAIQRAQMEVENIRFAVQQGIALEGQLKDFYTEAARRALEVAKFAMEAAISLRNAVLAKFTAEMEAYKISIDANGLLIQQELAKLDAYKAELEGARITSEVNRLEVEIYSANIQALMATVQVYRGELEGVNSRIEVDKTRIDAFTATVNAASEQIKAQAIAFGAYETQIKAENSKVSIYEAQVRGYAANIDAISEENKILVSNQQSKIAVQELKLRQIEIDARRFVAELGGQEAETDAYAARIRADATRVRADAAVQQANAANHAEVNKLKIIDAKNLADTAVANAQMFLNNLRSEADTAITAQVGVGNTQAAIANSALSAVNMSSSLGAEQSESTRFDTTCT